MLQDQTPCSSELQPLGGVLHLALVSAVRWLYSSRLGSYAWHVEATVLVLSFCNTQHMPGQRSHALGRLWSIAPHLTLDSHARDRVSCLFHAFFPAIFEHV